jgi:hypothetical protein
MLVTDIIDPGSGVPYLEDIESLIHHDALVDLLAREEIASTKTNREETVHVCGDKVIRLVGAKSSDAASVYYTPSVISDLCGSIPPKSVHFHGPYLSYQSPPDKAAHERLFRDGFKAGCAAGIDGLRCLVPSGHEYFLPWSDKFYERASGEGLVTIDGVKSVTCLQVEGGGGKKCTIGLRDGGGEYSNIFTEQIWEQEGASRPYVWFSEGVDLPLIEKTVSKGTRCVISETEHPPRGSVFKNNLASLAILHSRGDSGEKRRILTCFFREGA